MAAQVYSHSRSRFVAKLLQLHLHYRISSSSVERERIPGGCSGVLPDRLPGGASALRAAYPDGCSALLGRRIYGSKVLVREGDLAGVSPYMLLAFQVFGLALRGGYSVGLTGRAMLDEASAGTCCTQCVRACPTDVLEMAKMASNKAGAVATSPRTEDCSGCEGCCSACPTDSLSVRVYLRDEPTRSMGLGCSSKPESE